MSGWGSMEAFVHLEDLLPRTNGEPYNEPRQP